MKLTYFADTDTLYIDLVPGPSTETRVVTDDLIIDFDADKKVMGITIEHASKTIDLTTIETVDMPDTVPSAN